jgi:ArsR family transcriptional regulator, arsenate/arsenite/antimonite-responsive transcriptional repressor
MLQALADPTRLAVFQCIRGCGGATVYDTVTGQCDGGSSDSVAMCHVRCHVPCAPSTLSHHLNVLRDAGLITTEKRGREVYARVLLEALDQLSRFFKDDSETGSLPSLQESSHV